jgi:protease-4
MNQKLDSSSMSEDPTATPHSVPWDLPDPRAYRTYPRLHRPGYKLFKTRVSQGLRLTMARSRRMHRDQCSWAADALKMKLVDELGGIEKAVAKAAAWSKLKGIYAAPYPRQIPKKYNDRRSRRDWRVRRAPISTISCATLGTSTSRSCSCGTVQTQSAIQARMPSLSDLTKRLFLRFY